MRTMAHMILWSDKEREVRHGTRCVSSMWKGVRVYTSMVLHGLRNQISSSTHSSVVQRHVEFRTLGSSTSGNEKS